MCTKSCPFFFSAPWHMCFFMRLGKGAGRAQRPPSEGTQQSIHGHLCAVDLPPPRLSTKDYWAMWFVCCTKQCAVQGNSTPFCLPFFPLMFVFFPFSFVGPILCSS